MCCVGWNRKCLGYGEDSDEPDKTEITLFACKTRVRAAPIPDPLLPRCTITAYSTDIIMRANLHAKVNLRMQLTLRRWDVGTVLELRRRGRGLVTILNDGDVGPVAVLQKGWTGIPAGQSRDPFPLWERPNPSVFVRPSVFWPGLHNTTHLTLWRPCTLGGTSQTFCLACSKN